MKRISLVIIFLLILTNQFLPAQTIIPGGFISGTWEASDSPYLVQDDILVHPDSTLTINEGSTVLFFSKKMLEIQGQLLVEGTSGNPVVFDGDQDTTTWYGLFFNSTDTSITDSSVVEHAQISNCKGHPAVTIDHSDRVRLSGCKIQNNITFRGAGISCISSDPFFEGLLVQFNQSLDGAGISVDQSSPVIKNCTISQNYADGAGGGMVIFNGSSASLENCEISNNFSYGSGGGVYINTSESIFIHCNFIENIGAEMGGSYYSGGAVSVKLGAFTSFENCIFTDNSSNGSGGGIAAFSPGKIINCLFRDNHSEINGGALFLSSGNPIETKVTNNTFDNNSAPEASVLFCHSHVAVMKNCILWDSIAADTVSLIGLDAVMALDALEIAYSDLKYGQEGIVLSGNASYNWGQGNIELDPLFLPGTAELGWQSPCIEAGTSDTTGLGLPESDLAGNPRLANDRIDMGAFEYQFPVIIPNSIRQPADQIPGDFSVFPNPAKEWIQVGCTVPAENTTYSIIDFRGELVGKGILNDNGRTLIKVSDLRAGIYFIRFTGNDFSIAEKLVILD